MLGLARLYLDQEKRRCKSTLIGRADDSVPFHKLSQWLTYSLLEPMQKILGWEIKGTEVMTGMFARRNELKIGLPEYRNGGLLVDLGLLTLTDKAKSEAISENEGIYKFSPSSQTVIEWRAITVIALYVLNSDDPPHGCTRWKNKGRGADEQGQDRSWTQDKARLQLHPTTSPRECYLEMWTAYRS